MNTRPLGRTGLTVSEVGFGGWAIGGDAFGNSYGPTDDDVSKAALRCALELGVTLFDTADVYGHGHSEALLGEVLQGWEGPPPVVVTKGGVNFYRRDGTLEPDWTPYGLAHAVQQSLARLRRETLDVWMLMNPPVEELDRWRVWETLDALRRAGKVRYIGVSVAEPRDGVWLLKHHLPVDVLEVAYSLFYQGATTELLPLARRRKVGILAREPLANGFLTGKYAADARFSEGDIRAALPPEYAAAMAEMAGKLSFLTLEEERTRTQAALRFVLDDPGVSSVIVGAKTPAQVEENVAAASVPPIDDQERELIQRVFAE
ncbi:MAG: aldo/keto reductase [Armatimonadetes bacterium]|nr:aldo/keto reductase [Armatimonadota bacterium]